MSSYFVYLRAPNLPNEQQQQVDVIIASPNAVVRPAITPSNNLVGYVVMNQQPPQEEVIVEPAQEQAVDPIVSIRQKVQEVVEHWAQVRKARKEVKVDLEKYNEFVKSSREL